MCYFLLLFCFVFCFGHLDLIFSRCKAFTANKKIGPVVLTKSIIFSGNSILFLDFSYLLSIFFLLDDAFAIPAPVVFSDSLTKTTI